MTTTNEARGFARCDGIDEGCLRSRRRPRAVGDCALNCCANVFDTSKRCVCWALWVVPPGEQLEGQTLLASDVTVEGAAWSGNVYAPNDCACCGGTSACIVAPCVGVPC
jgi:hypothetical protein